MGKRNDRVFFRVDCKPIFRSGIRNSAEFGIGCPPLNITMNVNTKCPTLSPELMCLKISGPPTVFRFAKYASSVNSLCYSADFFHQT